MGDQIAVHACHYGGWPGAAHSDMNEAYMEKGDQLGKLLVEGFE